MKCWKCGASEFDIWGQGEDYCMSVTCVDCHALNALAPFERVILVKESKR